MNQKAQFQKEYNRILEESNEALKKYNEALEKYTRLEAKEKIK